MVRINRRHIAALLLTHASFFVKAYAEGETQTAPHVLEQQNAVETTPVVILVEEVNLVRDEKKDKPFTFSAGVNLNAFYDLQEYGAQYKFVPSKFNKDSKNPKVADAFVEAYLSISKEMHILGNLLTLNFLIEKEEGKTSLDLSNLYVENKWFKLGKAPGNFCTYLPTTFRYAAYQVAFKHDLGNGFSYTLAIEEAQGATIRAKEEDKKEQIIVEINDKDGKFAKIETIEEKPSEAKLVTSKRMPQLAFAANFAYKQDWGNVQLSGLGTVVEYSYSTPETIKHSYKYSPMFGAAVSGEYVFQHNKEYVDGKETFAGAHIKYRNGLGGYHGEAGGLPEHVNANFCISKDGKKIVTTLQAIGFGINAKHVWTKHLSSSTSIGMLLLLNSNKIEDIADSKKMYNNGFITKINPVAYNIGKNFTVAPAYIFGIANVIPKGEVKASRIHRIGIDIGYDF